MEAITLRELLEAVGGTLIGPAAGLEQTVSHVDTDSRNIHPGSLFIPLVGERFDGHAYINSALEGGAAGCLTQRERESYREDRFYIKVKDTQRALRDLAAWYKDRFPIPFVGVTGSVGKTTAKDMIAAVLGVKYKVLKTEGNFNNNIGLPLTLLRLDRTYQMGVLEMGMDKFGEIDYLGDIVRPEVGVITNIGDAHIEKLGSRENIFKAKCELLPHIRKENGLLILNADDEMLVTLRGNTPGGEDPRPGGAHDLPHPHRRGGGGALRPHRRRDREGDLPFCPHPHAHEPGAAGGEHHHSGRHLQRQSPVHAGGHPGALRQPQQL